MTKKHNVTIVLTLPLICLLVWCTVLRADSSHKDTSDAASTITFGYTPQIFYGVDSRDATVAIQTWASVASKKLDKGLDISTVTFKTFDDAEKALKNGEVDILGMLPDEFIQLRASTQLTPLLSADYGSHFYNDLLIAVRKDSGITGISQLRGKKILVDSGQQGTIPLKWLDIFLKEQNSTKAQGFFGSIIECFKASKALMPVFFRKADACLVSRSHYETMVELNPQIGHQLLILAQSPGFATGIVAMRRGVGNLKRDATVKVFQAMADNPRGRQVLTMFRINRLIPFLPEHLTSLEKVIKEHR